MRQQVFPADTLRSFSYTSISMPPENYLASPHPASDCDAYIGLTMHCNGESIEYRSPEIGATYYSGLITGALEL